MKRFNDLLFTPPAWHSEGDHTAGRSGSAAVSRFDMRPSVGPAAAAAAAAAAADSAVVACTQVRDSVMAAWRRRVAHDSFGYTMICVWKFCLHLKAPRCDTHRQLRGVVMAAWRRRLTDASARERGTTVPRERRRVTDAAAWQA
jgi:hypothetical protein